MRLHALRPATYLLASCLAAVASVAVATGAGADEIGRATITVDATGPEVVVTSRLSWTAGLDGAPRSVLTFWLSPGVRPTAASADGSALTVAEAGEAYGRKGWTVSLPSPLLAGESRSLDIVAVVSGVGTPGIGPGSLLPGAGWFPSTSAEVDERATHSTNFVLPEGIVGVAAGDAAENSWTTATAARPYAVWGDLRAEEVALGERRFVAWRPAGASGPVPRADRIAELLDVVASGLGEPPGAGDFKLVHVAGGGTTGGLRTLIWDENEAASPGSERGALLVDRGLATGWATVAWTELFRFHGDQAAFLSRAIPLYVGDVATIATDRSDDATPTERTVIRTRRDEFLAGRASGDRALAGLAPEGAESAWVLATRGALVAHQLAEACPTRASFVSFLGGFRRTYGGGDVDAAVFSAELAERFTNQHAVLDPLFRGTDLPAFRIVEHGPQEKNGARIPDRYRVKLENYGEITGAVDVSTFTAEGYLLRTFRMSLQRGQSRAIVFREIGRVASVELDPRGVALQSVLESQRIEVQGIEARDLPQFVPSFPFTVGHGSFHAIENLDLELPSVTIRGFSGYVQWWETHHGPSGAVLLGEGEVVIRPAGSHAASFQAQMHKEAVILRGAEVFVRFPVDAWTQIETQLGALQDMGVPEEGVFRRRQIFEHSFPSYFYEENRAIVPPPGSALVIFSVSEDDRRGWVRCPLPDGTVQMRMWDHLEGRTIWEETR